MSTSNGRQWVKHEGALPKGFEQIPEGGQGTEAVKPGFQSGTVWMKAGAGLVLRCDPLPIPGAAVGAGAAPAKVGAGWNPSGNNFIVTAAAADAACAGNFSTASAGYPQSIGADIDSWALSGVATGDSIFVWSGDDKKLYQFVKTRDPPGGAGFATLMVCSDGPMAQPGGGGGTGGCPAGQVRDASGNCVPAGSPGTSTASKVLPWIAVAGAVGLVGVGIAAYMKDKKHARTNPARGRGHRGPRRDSHGRFKG